MKRKLQVLSGVLVIALMGAMNASAQGVSEAETGEDTEVRLIDARVVEVTEKRISVFARSGVEHVIAIDRQGTKVTVEGETISLHDVREGDIITIELDEVNPVKFAKNISLKSTGEQVARVRQ